MKKILALTLAGILTLGGAAMLTACKKRTDDGPNGTVYLVPGTYVSDGETVVNTLNSGARKLTDEQCGEINTENAYLCTNSKGSSLPKPSSARTDADGNVFEFNGWWTIVNATVAYYSTVPEVAETETLFLYADWRAPLSQPKDPIIPEGGEVSEHDHYMIIKHADETQDKITLVRAWADTASAEKLGYKYAAELTTQAFTLTPGDKIYVYTTGLPAEKEEDANKAQLAPIHPNGCTIDLSASGDMTNDTADYLSATAPTTFRGEPYLTYKAEEAGLYNIYIKFFTGGTNMSVYLEPKV